MSKLEYLLFDAEPGWSQPRVYIFPDVLPATHDFHLMIYVELLDGIEKNLTLSYFIVKNT